MEYPAQIYELAQKLHWLQIADDGCPELYLDNQMLQTFRMCEALFYETYIEGYKPRGNIGRIWFLEFGGAFHKAVEEFYKAKKADDFDLIHFISTLAHQIWTDFDLEYWANTDLWKARKYNSYKELGGFLGFSSLLLQYAHYFSKENERFRTIGTELYFGKNKEVPLNINLNFQTPFRLYLSGKIDLLMDDGFNIGPMDHKTSRDFGGKNPARMYEVHDGMTGYVFAAKKILETRNAYAQDTSEDLQLLNRQCNKIWMNFVQVREAKTMPDRFKRIPIYKTDWELEEYRQRQISTAIQIWQTLKYYNPDRMLAKRPYYNTMACTNMMHRDCVFQEVHRQNSLESQFLILNSSFEKDQSKIWNPEEGE